MVEHEHLIAQHRQAVEIVRPLLMRNGCHGGLEPGDVRFERDRDPVAESTLDASADRAEKPRRGGRNAERQGCDAHLAGIVPQHALANQLEPERHERVRQGRQERQHERDEHQVGLVAVAQLAQSPHGR